MGRKRPKPTRSQARLLKLFSQVNDEAIRDIIGDVVLLEAKHRSAGEKNFPMQDVRDAVDKWAELREAHANAGGEDTDEV